MLYGDKEYKNMKKITALITVVFLLVVVAGLCAEKNENNKSAISDITDKFKIPADWKKVTDNQYILKDFNKTFKASHKFLLEGHQPWRLEPINIAAVCLWDFGIKDNSDDIFKFADRLTEIKENEKYMLKAGNTNYYIYVRVNKTIPIAYKLEIEDIKK